MKENRSRLIEIDVFKGICILAVIAIHMSGIIANGSNLSIKKIDDFYLFSIITRFCVPGFILVSGLLLAYRHEKIASIDFLRKKFTYILIPYFIWTFLYIYFWAYMNNQPRLRYFDAIIFGTGSYHLYFVLIIIQYYIIYLIIQKIVDRIKPWFLLILFVAQILLNYWAKAINFSPFSYNYATTFLPWIFIFFFGCYVGRNYETCVSVFTKYRNLLYIGLLVALFYQLSRYLQLLIEGENVRKIPDGLVIVPTLLIFMIVISFAQEISQLKEAYILKCLSRLGKLSFGIFLTHPLVIPFLVLRINSLFEETPMLLIYCEFVVTILISWAMTEILSRFKLIRILVGK